MIKCDGGKLEMQGEYEMIAAELMTLMTYYRNKILLDIYEDDNLADNRLKEMTDIVIQYCREEK